MTNRSNESDLKRSNIDPLRTEEERSESETEATMIYNGISQVSEKERIKLKKIQSILDNTLYNLFWPVILALPLTILVVIINPSLIKIEYLISTFIWLSIEIIFFYWVCGGPIAKYMLDYSKKPEKSYAPQINFPTFNSIVEFTRDSYNSSGIPLLVIFNVYRRIEEFNQPYSVFYMQCQKAIKKYYLVGTILKGCYIPYKQKDITNRFKPEIVQQSIYYLLIKTNTMIIPLQQIYIEYINRLEVESTITYNEFHKNMIALAKRRMIGGTINREKTWKNPYDDVFHITIGEYYCISCNKKASLYELPFRCRKCSRYICNDCHIIITKEESFKCPYCNTSSPKIYQYKVGTTTRTRSIELFSRRLRRKKTGQKLRKYFRSSINSTILIRIIRKIERDTKESKIDITSLHLEYLKFTKAEINYTTFYLGIIGLRNQHLLGGIIDIQETPNNLLDDVLVLKKPVEKEETILKQIDLKRILKELDVNLIQQEYQKLRKKRGGKSVSIKNIKRGIQKETGNIIPYDHFYQGIEQLMSLNLLNGQIDKGEDKEIREHELILIFPDSFMCQLCSKNFNDKSTLIQCQICMIYVCKDCSEKQKEVGLNQCPVCETEIISENR